MNNAREKRIAALNAAQEQRKQNCLDKTEKAIAKLLQTNQKLSIANLARVAGVSISYLYKYPEIKERIQSLRRQQEQVVKRLQPPSRSEKSTQVIIGQLKERIKSLEWEKKELRKQNEALTGRLYFMSNTQDLIERLKADNSKLKTENEQFSEQLESARKELKELNDYQQVWGSSHLRVSSFELTRNQPTTNEIDDELRAKFSEVGISLNQTLLKLVKSAPEEQVLNALSVVKEANASGQVRSRSGLFRKALNEGWEPNETDAQREANLMKSNFVQWYDLARHYGIVIGFREEDGIMMVQENTGHWYPFEEFSAKWTLEYLKRTLHVR